MRLRGFLATLLICTAVALPAAAQSTLYAELGGTQGLTRLVKRMFDLAVQDPRIAKQFDNINFDWLRPRVTLFFCQRVGGPCHYPGRDMHSAHKGLHLATREFNAMVEDLQIAMNEQGIPFPVQNRFLALLAPLRRDMVTR
jgi:hemoglobin